MNKKMKVVFTMSLVANIFLIGFVGGQAYKLQGQKVQWRSGEGLSSGSKALMRQSFMQNRQDAKPLFENVQQKKRALIAVFVAEEFDVQAYKVVAADLLFASSEVSKHKLEMFMEVAKKSSQEERQSLSKIMAKKIFGKSHHERSKKYREKHERYDDDD